MAPLFTYEELAKIAEEELMYATCNDVCPKYYQKIYDAFAHHTYSLLAVRFSLAYVLGAWGEKLSDPAWSNDKPFVQQRMAMSLLLDVGCSSLND